MSKIIHAVSYFCQFNFMFNSSHSSTAGSCNTTIENMPYHPKDEGSSPAATVGSRSEKSAKKFTRTCILANSIDPCHRQTKTARTTF
jgi:hypothetical protein